jgi:hypothetical protein
MIAASAPSCCLMPTCELPYAKEHLFELFKDARAGDAGVYKAARALSR